MGNPHKFDSEILTESLSKKGIAAKESMITDFSRLLAAVSTCPLDTDEKWQEAIKLCDNFIALHPCNFSKELARVLLEEKKRQTKTKKSA